jgi:hypothetical protein
MRDTSIQQELVPLQEAMASAYHVLFDSKSKRRSRHEMDSTRAEIAIALAAVAKILARDADHLRLLTIAELEERIKPPRAGADFSDLYIRRCDLIQAIEMLKNPIEG